MINNNNFKSKVILVLVSLIIIIALGITYQVLALNPPTNQPPTGGGTIGVGSNAPGNSLYITSAGNVGIGTTAPTAKLELGNNQWLMLNPVGISAGINFYETGSKSATDVQYGGKIFYDGGNDRLQIVTRENNADILGISIARVSGNVGIGTTAPGQKLDVSGNTILSGDYKLYLRDTNRYIGSGRNNDFSIVNKASTWLRIGSANGIAIWGTSGADTNDVPHIFIDTGGKVGIGTTAPGAKLDVNGNIKVNDILSRGGETTFSLYQNTDFFDSWTGIEMWGSGTRAGEMMIFGNYIDFRTGSTATGNSSVKMKILDNGNVGIGTTAPGAKLEVDGTIGAYSDSDSWIVLYPGGDTTSIIWDNATSPGGGLNFSTWDTFTGGSYSIKMTVTNAGNVGIGTTAPGEKLHVNGNVKATAFYYGSDQSLKTNIKPFDKSLQKILNLEPVYFDYKENNQHSFGFIAQDVEKQFPELVTTDSLTGLKSLDYSRLAAPLVGAIKEQQEQINSLTQIVESQQEQIEELKNLLK